MLVDLLKKKTRGQKALKKLSFFSRKYGKNLILPTTGNVSNTKKKVFLKNSIGTNEVSRKSENTKHFENTRA